MKCMTIGNGDYYIELVLCLNGLVLIYRSLLLMIRDWVLKQLSEPFNYCINEQSGGSSLCFHVLFNNNKSNNNNIFTFTKLKMVNFVKKTLYDRKFFWYAGQEFEWYEQLLSLCGWIAFVTQYYDHLKDILYASVACAERYVWRSLLHMTDIMLQNITYSCIFSWYYHIFAFISLHSKR